MGLGTCDVMAVLGTESCRLGKSSLIILWEMGNEDEPSNRGRLANGLLVLACRLLPLELGAFSCSSGRMVWTYPFG